MTHHLREEEDENLNNFDNNNNVLTRTTNSGEEESVIRYGIDSEDIIRNYNEENNDDDVIDHPHIVKHHIINNNIQHFSDNKGINNKEEEKEERTNPIVVEETKIIEGAIDVDIDHLPEQPENPEQHARQQWGSRLSFILATLGAAIGFGSFVRFPYLAYKNGGGAFLIPYTIALIVLGIPLLILELSLGQILRKSSIYAFEQLQKRSKGIGLVMTLFGGFGICSYYSILISYVFVYAYHMFNTTLPWTGKSEQFFYEVILRKSTSDTEVNELNIPILISLFLVWVTVYFGIWKGTKSTGIITYITVPLPMILFLILFITSFFLEGSFNGMYYYIKPDFTKLADVNIWLSAAGQIFALSLSSGTITALSSFNKPNQDIVKDAWIIGISTYFFSIFAGFCVFSILGYMAHQKGLSVDQVTDSGIGLAFIVLPEAISLMPFPHLFCAFFLLALYTLAIDSCFGMMEGVNAAIHDTFPKLKLHWIALITCFLCFLFGIPYCLDNGYYLMDIVDHWLSDFCLVFSAVLECILIGYLISSESLRTKLKRLFNKNSYQERVLDEEDEEDIGETVVSPISNNEEESNNRRRSGMKRKIRKLWECIKLVAFHSVDEHRLKIKAICQFGPSYDFNLIIKFIAPILLTILFIIALIKEITSPYSTKGKDSKEFDWLSLTIGLSIVCAYFLILVLLFFFPNILRKRETKVEESEKLDVSVVETTPMSSDDTALRETKEEIELQEVEEESYKVN
ncbi:hypothetical protein ABK040_012371 [Willaertia magna]